LVKQVNCIAVYVPWQPEILSGVGKLKTFDHSNFVEIYYHNPYLKVKLKRHGEY
jgi:hypothetical protein